MNGIEKDEEQQQIVENSVEPNQTHEQTNDIYCEACKQNPKDKSQNQDAILCTSCREQLIRYPYPKWLYAVMALVLVICVISFFRVPTLVSNYKDYKSAESSYNNMNYNTAANSYQILGDSYKSSMRIHERLFLALMKSQRFSEATVVFDENLAEKDANDETYEEINDYLNLLNGYYITAEKLDPIMQTDPQFSEPEKLYTQVEALANDTECDQAIVLYYLAQLNSLMNKTDLATTQFRKAYALQPKYTFITSDIGLAQRRAKQYDAAIITYNEALTKNADDESAFRGLGVVSMLKGEYDEGVEYTKKAYELNPNGGYVAETYATALYAAGKKTEANEIYETLKQSEYFVLDQDYEDYFAGKMSIVELYLS